MHRFVPLFVVSSIFLASLAHAQESPPSEPVIALEVAHDSAVAISREAHHQRALATASLVTFLHGAAFSAGSVSYGLSQICIGCSGGSGTFGAFLFAGALTSLSLSAISLVLAIALDVDVHSRRGALPPDATLRAVGGPEAAGLVLDVAF